MFGVKLFEGTPVFTLSKGRGRFRRPRRKSVRGLPLMVSAPATTCGCNRIQATPFFTLSEGRGRTCPGPDPRFGRLRPKSVRGLPGTHPHVTHAILLRERAGACPGLDPGVRVAAWNANHAHVQATRRGGLSRDPWQRRALLSPSPLRRPLHSVSHLLLGGRSFSLALEGEGRGEGGCMDPQPCSGLSSPQ